MSNFNINKLIRPTIKQLQPYSSARNEFKNFKADYIFLDANENPFSNGVNRYPDPQQKELKKIIAKQKKIATKNILLGNGSDEILDLIFRAFCEPSKDAIITCGPSYGMYNVLAKINNIKNNKILLLNDFQLDVSSILSNSLNTSKVLFICNPNNPTANNFKKEALEKILNNFLGLIVIDEAYIDFSEEKSWLTQLKKYPNLIITQTLSKAYGAAAIRLGICYASEEIIAILNKIKPPYNVNLLTQQKAIEVLKNQKKYREQLQLILSEKKEIIRQLQTISFVQKVFPSSANFILFKVDNANKRYQQLIANKIVVRNRTNEPLCENCLRITVGTPKENLRTLEIMNNL